MSALTHTANRLMKPLPLLGLFLAAGLILSIAVSNVLAAVKSHPAAPGIEAGMLRGRQADAARWNAMAEHFAAKQASNLERSRIAEAARWNLMAAHSEIGEVISLERSRIADAARYTGLAANYAARQAANLERARMADAARWNLMAEHFAANP